MNRNIEFSAVAPALNAVLWKDEVRAFDDTFSVQVVTPGTTTTLVVEGSNDNVNWVALSGVAAGYSAAPAAVASTTAAGITVYMVQTRFVRSRVSVAGTGTVSGAVCFGAGWTR